MSLEPIIDYEPPPQPQPPVSSESLLLAMVATLLTIVATICALFHQNHIWLVAMAAMTFVALHGILVGIGEWLDRRHRRTEVAIALLLLLGNLGFLGWIIWIFYEFMRGWN